jgi:hypothetical protein
VTDDEKHDPVQPDVLVICAGQHQVAATTAAAPVFPVYPTDKTGWPVLDATGLQPLVAKHTTVPYGKIEEPDDVQKGKRDWVTNTNWYIQEKNDGSLFSCEVESGIMYFYSRAAPLTDITNQYYRGAMIALLTKFKRDPTAFNENEVLCGESMCRRKHSKLMYDKVPVDFFTPFNIILKDTKKWLSVTQLAARCAALGYTTVRLLHDNAAAALDERSCNAYAMVNILMAKINSNELMSALGGKMEGVILKCDEYVWPNGTVSAMKQKFVRDDFREKKSSEEKKLLLHEQQGIFEIGTVYNVPARFHKALQRYRERNVDGKLTMSGALLAALKADLEIDLESEQKAVICAKLSEDASQHEILYKKHKTAIMRASYADLPVWLKGEM